MGKSRKTKQQKNSRTSEMRKTWNFKRRVKTVFEKIRMLQTGEGVQGGPVDTKKVEILCLVRREDGTLMKYISENGLSILGNRYTEAELINEALNAKVRTQREDIKIEIEKYKRLHDELQAQLDELED